MPVVPEREFGPHVNASRAELIRVFAKKWVNGTVLNYYFFDRETDGKYVYLNDGSRQWKTWTSSEEEKNVVREAFAIWKEVNIGLQFKEVASREEAGVRIGFMDGDGAWSYVGRDIIDLNIGKDERTMNFGWDLTRTASGIDTPVHEIGHTLGFPHEHQNPNAGIVWDEEAVYADLAGYPNYWSRDKTYYNIIRKITPDTVQGSNWDPDSIMHYPFRAGLIESPQEYQNGLSPAGGLSDRDKTWVKTFYPPVDEEDTEELVLFESSKLILTPGEQKEFFIKPTETRKYNIATFGASDTVIVLLEESGDNTVYLAGDDDSGEEYNANLQVKLFRGKKYILRVRLYYSQRTGETAVMCW